MVFLSMFAHPLQGPLRIGNHVGILLAAEQDAMTPDEGTDTSHAIAQYKGRDAIALQPLRHAVAFGLLVKPIITASGTYDDGKTCVVVFSQIRRQGDLFAMAHVVAIP